MAFSAKESLIGSSSGSADFWTASGFETGMQNEVLSAFVPASGMTTASSRLQVSRLRTAWRAVRSTVRSFTVYDAVKYEREAGAEVANSKLSDAQAGDADLVYARAS